MMASTTKLVPPAKVGELIEFQRKGDGEEEELQYQHQHQVILVHEMNRNLWPSSSALKRFT